MFINVSNHPSSLWGAEQLAAAEAMGPVSDLPFPSVSPEWSTEQVVALAGEWADRILARIGACPEAAVVHVMGEAVFSYHLVRLLLAAGVRVVASTTERTVVYSPVGKTSTFRFVRFREY